MRTLAERPGYTWVIAGLCFLTVMVSVGFFYNTLALFLEPITTALGIERGTYSACGVIASVMGITVNVLFSTLVTRFRPRKLMLFGTLGMAGSSLLFALSKNVLYLCGAWFLEGSCSAFCSTTMVSYVLSRRFTENRGAVMGAVVASTGIGLAVASQILSPIIDGKTSFLGRTGYPAAQSVNTLLLLCVFTLLLVLFRDAPEREQAPLPQKRRGRTWIGTDWTQVRKNPVFYLMAVCMFLTAVAVHSPLGVSPAHLKFAGLDENLRKNLVSIYAVVLCVAKLFVGRGYDRFGLRATLSFCCLASVASTLCLAFASPECTGVALAHELLLGLAIPLEMILLPLTAAELFGETAYAKVLGIYLAIYSAGCSLGALAVNRSFDLAESYRPAFYACAALLLLVVIAEQFLFRRAERERAAIEASQKEATT